MNERIFLFPFGFWVYLYNNKIYILLILHDHTTTTTTLISSSISKFIISLPICRWVSILLFFIVSPNFTNEIIKSFIHLNTLFGGCFNKSTIELFCEFPTLY